jgi:hypothetical protein
VREERWRGVKLKDAVEDEEAGGGELVETRWDLKC